MAQVVEGRGAEPDRDRILAILKAVRRTDDIKILDYGSDSQDVKGKGYQGRLVAYDFVAEVDKSKEEFHWMIKLPPTDPNQANLQRDAHVQEKEMLFYSTIVPAWKSLISERNATFELFCHDSPYAEFHKEEDPVLVMQNLVHLGYEPPPDVKSGLPLAYAKAALAELAKFHALGYVYLSNYPGGIKEGIERNKLLTTDCFQESPLMKAAQEGFRDPTITQAFDITEAVQDPGQDLVGILRRFHEERDILKRRDSLKVVDPSEFNTLCHGDAHFNNMLFRSANGDSGGKEVKNASLLDMAVVRLGNPCTDLAYFFYISTTPQLRATHLEDMLGHYHDVFVRCLHELGEDPVIYPFRHLVRDFNKYAYYGFIMSFFVVPPALAPKEEAIGQDATEGLDLTNPADVAKLMKVVQEKMKRAYRKEPRIKMMMAGNFIDMLERKIIQA